MCRSAAGLPPGPEPAKVLHCRKLGVGPFQPSPLPCMVPSPEGPTSPRPWLPRRAPSQSWEPPGVGGLHLCLLLLFCAQCGQACSSDRAQLGAGSMALGDTLMQTAGCPARGNSWPQGPGSHIEKTPLSREPAPGHSLWATVPCWPRQRASGSGQHASPPRLPAGPSNAVLRGQRTS